MWHTNKTTDDFDLVSSSPRFPDATLTTQPVGRNITLQLLQLASDLRISEPLGIAPKDLYLARYPYGHSHSILTEWAGNVLPATVYEKGRSETRLIITQTGSIRFDLVRHSLIADCEEIADDQFQGTFSRNDELTLSPL
jgi:hypothetical protein